MNPWQQAGGVLAGLVTLVSPGLLAPSAAAPAFESVETVTAQPFPVKIDQAAQPVVRAKSALVIDLPSNRPLYEQNPDEELPIASLTKLMTAVVVLEHAQPTDLVTIPPERVTSEESQVGLQPGQVFSVRDLMAAMLVASGNDAAHALAIHVSGNEKDFVKLMNEKAHDLELDHTTFATASGFDPGKSRSTASELAVIARMAIAQPLVREVAGQKELTITAADGTPYVIKTTDELIGGYLPIAGLKTGTTDEAGLCLISVLDSGNRQLLAIVLNSPDRFQENKSMFDWALRAYRWDRAS
jgi:D-alanyl-D-alanine carboxypeptidase (penicillin-binding protein 5/6)